MRDSTTTGSVSVGSFGDGFLGRNIGHISTYLKFVAGENSFVDDAKRHVLEVEIFNPRQLISIDLAVRDLAAAVHGGVLARELRARGCQIPCIFLFADLRVECRRPLAGCAGGVSRRET